LAAVVSALLPFSQAAKADSVTAYLSNLGPYTTDLNISFDAGTTKYNNVYAGGINWKILNWSPGTAPSPTLQTFCIEGTEDVVLQSNSTWTFGSSVPLADAPKPWTSLTGLSGMGATKAAYLEEFWNKNYQASWALNTTSTTSSANIAAAAFQLGVWEIVYDGLSDKFGSITSANLSSGTFEVLNGTSGQQKLEVDAAVAMLNKITGTYNQTTDVQVLSGVGVQDQIYGTSVPLPAALPAGLSLLGVLGLIGVRARRKTL